jgi:hypothetical protein
MKKTAPNKGSNALRLSKETVLRLQARTGIRTGAGIRTFIGCNAMEEKSSKCPTFAECGSLVPACDTGYSFTAQPSELKTNNCGGCK